MAKLPKMVRCKGPCQRILPLIDRNFRWLAEQRCHDCVCRDCRNAERREQRKAQKLEAGSHIRDWATAMIRSIKSACTRNSEPLDIRVTPAYLRDLMTDQQNRCQYLQRQFVLPTPAELETHGNWSSWDRSLPQPSRDLIPVLVRISHVGPWEPGNLTFISTKLIELYLACKDAQGFREFCSNVIEKPIVAYQPDLTARHQAERMVKPEEAHEA